MKYLFSSTLAATAAAAFSNSVPIYGSYPGWKVGSAKTGITLELHYDLLCEDSKGLDPVIQSLLATEWNGSTVQDQITVEYSLFPLPYHLHTWQVNQLMPYFMDNCMEDASQCEMMNKYKDYSFKMQGDVLSWDTLSKQDTIKKWTGLVADEFKLNQADLELCYNRSEDLHDTEDKLREMWKYATAMTTSGTPTAFINGVKLDSNPSTVDGWMEVLNSLYDSQWPQVKAAKEKTFLQ